MRYFSLQGPFAQVIFVAFQSGNLSCIVTILLANTDSYRCLVTVAPQITDKLHKNFEQVRLTATTRAGDGRLTCDGSVRNAPPLHRVI